MVQGALFVPGFARADCHGDGTPIRPGASGTKAAEDVPPGLSRYRLSRLICRRPTSAVSGNWEPTYPACRAFPSGTGSTGTRWLGSRLRRSVGGRVGGYGAQSEYIKVRSVVDDRAESAGAQQVVAIGPQIPQARLIRSSGLPSRCHKGHRREQQAPATRLLIRRSSVISRADHCGAGPPGSRRCEPARPAVAGGQHHGQRGLHAPEVRPPRPSATANSQRPHTPHLVVLPD